jgi:hypothetical protein
MGWEWRGTQMEAVNKGDLPAGADTIVVPGGRSVPMPPTVAYSHDQGKRSWDFWFEDLGFKSIDINTYMPGINVFRYDTLIHPADNRLKIYVTHWKGDQDATRTLYVIRTPAFWID